MLHPSKSSQAPVELLCASEITELEALLDLEKGWDTDFSLFRDGCVGESEETERTLLAEARASYFSARAFCIQLIKAVCRVYTYDSFRNEEGCSGDLYKVVSSVRHDFEATRPRIGYKYAFDDLINFIFNLIDNKRVKEDKDILQFIRRYAHGELKREADLMGMMIEHGDSVFGK